MNKPVVEITINGITLRQSEWCFKSKEEFKKDVTHLFVNESTKFEEEVYEIEDYLLIRDGRVVAISGNSIFDDGDAPVEQQEGDTIAYVVESRGKENDTTTQRVLENIKNTIARCEQQKGSPLTLRQKLFIANHRLEHLTLRGERGERYLVINRER